MRHKLAQDIEILVYLPTFCLENVIFRTSELQHPWALIRINNGNIIQLW